MRFLLDESYPPVAAERLRDRGIDAVAVKESPALGGLEDDALLALATLDRRVLVTENIADFAVLGRAAEHVGIVFCHPRRFPRSPDHIHRLVDALAMLASSAPHGFGDQPRQWWLEPPAPH
ncbi:MAG: DUF5615 family PIN-like protein [Actinomycetota bacterium]|nr:DUF5615 family PIN-like protein [Actinomycetota bacterium]